MPTIRITALILLLILALPFSALAMEEIPVTEAIQAADHELASDSSYQQASTAAKKLLRNAAIRRQIVVKTQAQLDAMQQKLDREFDVRLAKAFDKDGGLLILASMKKEFVSRFKAEMYLSMAENDASKITTTFRNAEDGSGNIENFIERNLKNQIRFENDIEKILTKISADLKAETGKDVNGEWKSIIVGLIGEEFNK